MPKPIPTLIQAADLAAEIEKEKRKTIEEPLAEIKKADSLPTSPPQSPTPTSSPKAAKTSPTR